MELFAKRWLVGGTVVYAASTAFCALGVTLLAPAARSTLASYLWVFGPSANLVHGVRFMWPFAMGTVLVALSMFGIVRVESPLVQMMSGVMLLFTWAAFGVLVYAPGA